MRRVKRCLVGLEHAFLPEMREELTSGHILHEHIEMPGALSESIEVDNEGMSDTAEDAILIVDMIDLLRLDEFFLLHDFDAGIFIGRLLLHQPHPAEGTLA